MSDSSSELYKALSYSTTEFDKNVLFIASGALGISIAFIDKVVEISDAKEKYLLITSWYIFGVTIFICLVTHFIAMLANRWAIVNEPPNDCSNDKDISYRDGCNKWNLSIRVLNVAMIISLLVGIIFLINFIQNNI